MKNTKFANTVKILALLCLCLAPLAHADGKLEDLSIMATGPLDGRAVVKAADGKMHVLNIGDKLPGTQATLIQVLADKLVVEESVGKEGQPKVKQTAWILKSAKPGDASSVQRFDSEGPEPVLREMTVAKPLSGLKTQAKKPAPVKSEKKAEQSKAKKAEQSKEKKAEQSKEKKAEQSKEKKAEQSKEKKAEQSKAKK